MLIFLKVLGLLKIVMAICYWELIVSGDASNSNIAHFFDCLLIAFLFFFWTPRK